MKIQQHYFTSYTLILLEFLKEGDMHAMIHTFQDILGLVLNHFCCQSKNC